MHRKVTRDAGPQLATRAGREGAARESKPDLRDELMRRMGEAKAAERAQARRATEHAEKMAELQKISRLLEENNRKSTS